LDNRPGGGGTVGVAAVVEAEPDGYTFLLSSSAMSTAVILHKSLPYDTLGDLEPVAMFGGEPSMLVGAPGKGVTSVPDLVAAAKANPGGLKFASVGIGSASHIAGERFRLAAGLNVQHIAYAGPGQALADLTAGRVDFYFIPVTPALPLITEGTDLSENEAMGLDNHRLQHCAPHRAQIADRAVRSRLCQAQERRSCRRQCRHGCGENRRAGYCGRIFPLRA
jgi:hypothetical protein